MKKVAHALAIGLAVIAAGPAKAADWWLIRGVPSDQTAIFADVGTLTRHHNSAQMRVLRVDRWGQTTEMLQQIQCNRSSASTGGEMVRTFACASVEDRDQHGLILASMDPLQVARMIFAGNGIPMVELGLEPHT